MIQARKLAAARRRAAAARRRSGRQVRGSSRAHRSRAACRPAGGGVATGRRSGRASRCRRRCPTRWSRVSIRSRSSACVEPGVERGQVHAERRRDRDRARRRGATVRLSVLDNGPGIDARARGSAVRPLRARRARSRRRRAPASACHSSSSSSKRTAARSRRCRAAARHRAARHAAARRCPRTRRAARGLQLEVARPRRASRAARVRARARFRHDRGGRGQPGARRGGRAPARRPVHGDRRPRRRAALDLVKAARAAPAHHRYRHAGDERHRAREAISRLPRTSSRRSSSCRR